MVIFSCRNRQRSGFGSSSRLKVKGLRSLSRRKVGLEYLKIQRSSPGVTSRFRGREQGIPQSSGVGSRACTKVQGSERGGNSRLIRLVDLR